MITTETILERTDFLVDGIIVATLTSECKIEYNDKEMNKIPMKVVREVNRMIFPFAFKLVMRKEEERRNQLEE